MHFDNTTHLPYRINLPIHGTDKFINIFINFYTQTISRNLNNIPYLEIFSRLKNISHDTSPVLIKSVKPSKRHHEYLLSPDSAKGIFEL